MYYELVIVGAGLTGIRVALRAAELGINHVLILDYEKKIGGFDRSLFERQEFAAEKILVEQAKQLKYEFWTQSTVVGFFPGEPHQINVQTPMGTKDIEAGRVILCSGSLEKPREAHLIPGTRPAGVMTPLMAAGLLEHNMVPGRKCVVIDNGKISKATADLLTESGADVVTFPADTLIRKIKGNARVTEVELLDLKTGETNSYPCDTVIFSEGVIPCTFYLKGTEIERDQKHAIIVDEKGKTNVPGVFAFGSCTNRKFDYFSNDEGVWMEALEN